MAEHAIVAVTQQRLLGFDALARAILPAISLLFVVCGLYGVPYLRLRPERPNRAFVAALAVGRAAVRRRALAAGLAALAAHAHKKTLGTAFLKVKRENKARLAALVRRELGIEE